MKRWSFRLMVLMAPVSIFEAAVKGQPPKNPPPKSAEQEKTSGVILKVEPIGESEKSPRGWKLTVNTDVVWRDFVRDQAAEPKKVARTGTAKAAKKGVESVASEGHPKDNELLFTVEIDPRTEITMRYRSSTDSIGEGSPTAEGAARAEAITSSTSGEKTPAAPPAGSTRQSPKARVLGATELKPGLWVDIDFRKADQRNMARRVAVLRPVGGADTSPAEKNRSSSPSR